MCDVNAPKYTLGSLQTAPSPSPGLTEDRQTHKNLHLSSLSSTWMQATLPSSSTRYCSYPQLSGTWGLYGYKRRAPCKTLFMRGPMGFLANQVLYFPFSTKTMENYMANNKTPALIKYPIHNSIKSFCWHNQQRGTLMNTQISPHPKCTTQHSPTEAYYL